MASFESTLREVQGAGRGKNNFNGPEEVTVRRLGKRGVIARLGGYLLHFKWLLFLALIMSLASNLLSLVGPKLSGLAIDAIEPGVGKVDFSRVYYYAALMAVFFLFSSIFAYLLAILMIHISQKIIFKMREDVFDSLGKLPVSYFDTHQTGEILSKISYDIDTVNTSLSTDIIQILTSIITVVGSFAMMITISPPLILVFVFTVPLSFVITKFLTGRTRPLFRARSASIGRMNGYVEEMIAGHKTIKAYNQEKNVIQKFDMHNEEVVGAFYKADYFGTMTGPSVNFINNLSLSLITVFGAILFIKGRISLGNISSFVLYSRKFSGPINEAANIMNEFQSAFAAAERVFRLIDEPREALDIVGAKELTDVTGDVRIDDVTFGYVPEKPVLKDLNLNARPGSLTAIVGPTGAGKTTIINLLMRFYDVNEGAIYVDNNEIRTVTRDSLRQSYAMVLQDTWLFTGTVFENIAYGRENATREEVIAAAKAARVHDFIESLPDGYDTILTEEGTNISKGQKQLLTIARAMLMDTRMLILDEATSNVDTRTEIMIQQAMRNLMKDKTCFVIAHRLSTIRNADAILVVQDGKIAEQGTHSELIAQDGIYKKMYYAQYE
ncbi:MAG: ABC transporter ATP-binding protein [Thermoflexaceae bacterium]|nr:ABC transporter ATP-binding protein [Thermoflexaceae bacterium]